MPGERHAYAECLNVGDNSASDCRAVVKAAASQAIGMAVETELAQQLGVVIFSKMHDSTKMVVSVPEDRILAHMSLMGRLECG